MESSNYALFSFLTYRDAATIRENNYFLLLRNKNN